MKPSTCCVARTPHSSFCIVPLIGAHVSIAGGIANAPARAAAEGCECFQIFTRSPQGGAAPPITDAIAQAFREACAAAKQRCWVVHTPYYINCASAEERVRKSSSRIIREELERASAIGALAVMTHLGSARDTGGATGRSFVIAAITNALRSYTGTARFCIEISAGAGATVGGTFEEIAEIITGVEDAHQKNLRAPSIGVCFDTQHAFASGYDLRTPAGVNRTLEQFDATIGLDRLVLSHIQDSKVTLGEHKDRHEHIGSGHIGIAGLRAFVRHPAICNLPLILETETDARREDIRLLKGFRDA